MAQHNLDLAKESSVQEILDKVSSAGSVIKSVQRGVINITGSVTTGTATITEVDPDKSLVLFGGSVGRFSSSSGTSYNSSSGYWDARLDLTSSTVVTATIYYNTASTDVFVSWQVVEFY